VIPAGRVAEVRFGVAPELVLAVTVTVNRLLGEVVSELGDVVSDRYGGGGDEEPLEPPPHETRSNVK